MHNNKQWTIVVVIAAVALTGWLIAGCGGGGGTTPAGTGSVSGSTVIMDTIPPEPAGGVTVTVGGQQSVSDGGGNFTVTGVPAGTWEVVATSDIWQQAGYPPEVVVVAGQTTALGAPILMTLYGPPPPPGP